MSHTSLTDLRSAMGPLHRSVIQVLSDALRIVAEGDESGWRADHLGAPTSKQVCVKHRGTPLQMDVLSVVLGSHVAKHRESILLRGIAEKQTPEWCSSIPGVEVGWPRPFRAETGFPAGTLASFPVIAKIDLGPALNFSLTVDDSHHNEATDLMSVLVDQTRGELNPFRHQILNLEQTQYELTYRAIPAPDPQAHLLSLPDQVWDEIKLFTSAAGVRRDTLRRAGFSTSRGILMAGPPGCGKSHLIRVMLSDLLPTHTVLLPDSDTIRDDIDDVYAMARTLGPIVVVLEDLDAVIGDRASTPTFAHVSRLLNALDGVDALDDVLTIATANDPSLIDPAVTRTGRLDSHVFVPKPDLTHRRRIIESLTEALGLNIDAATVAAALDGASGSDMREVVHRAVLERGDAFDTADLLDITRTGRWAPKPLTGNYL